MSLHAVLPENSSIEYKVDENSLATEYGIFQFSGIHSVSAVQTMAISNAVVILGDKDRMTFQKIVQQLDAKVVQICQFDPDCVNICLDPKGTQILVNKLGQPVQDISEETETETEKEKETEIKPNEIRRTKLLFKSKICLIYEVVDPMQLQWHLDTLSEVMDYATADTPYCRFRNSVFAHLLIGDLNEREVSIYMKFPMANSELQLYLQTLSQKWYQWLSIRKPVKIMVDLNVRCDLNLQDLKRQVCSNTLELVSLYNSELEGIMSASMDQLSSKEQEISDLVENISQLEKTHSEYESEIKNLERELNFQNPSITQTSENKMCASRISKGFPTSIISKKSTNELIKGMELELQCLQQEANELDPRVSLDGPHFRNNS